MFRRMLAATLLGILLVGGGAVLAGPDSLGSIGLSGFASNDHGDRDDDDDGDD